MLMKYLFICLFDTSYPLNLRIRLKFNGSKHIY
ncbi:hypothetical protein CYPRO_0809 [Cyclonatronum proteinivorum]|uniref:Uncharacterized protein n=1 Tax=Cyclonatronum proteinivorum TaxID=1457365 RepID=A0A345UHY4_9BACT|nr:hypothetical protein CYPRO_0809 [Cyclonatronum proteinivorum]